MSPRAVFFIGLFGLCSAMALAEPFAGIVAYVVYYHTGPERTWWGQGLAAAGLRYNLAISICLAAGTLLNLGRLRYGRFLTRQEVLYLAFLGWIVVAGMMFPMQAATFRGMDVSQVDHVDKMLKSAVFVLCLTHIVVTPRRFKQFLWLLTACAFYLGQEAYFSPPRLEQGRLEGFGGPDFNNSNALGAHCVSLLPLIGILFLRSDWKGKAATFLAGGFLANVVMLAKSRASMLAAAVGVLATAALVPRDARKRVWPLLLLGCLGGLSLMDSTFGERMDTMEGDNLEKDESAQERLRVWSAGARMIRDNPLGVGPGNFNAHVGHYNPELTGRDAHNTYVACAADLGIPGVALFGAMIANGFWTLGRIRRDHSGWPGGADLVWQALGLTVSLLMYLVGATFGTYLYTEMFWWLLLLPAALERVAASAELDPAGYDPARA